MVYNQMTSATAAVSTEATGTSKRRLEETDEQQPSCSGGGSRSKNLNQPNHILLLTVVKPIYPITVDVLHKICSPFGNVLRIVIFRKNGVQAMVEFENIKTATLAKESLDGADIYSDCCTLKIEYAKPERLSVYKNYSLTWDFTKTAKESGSNTDSKQPLLQYPPSMPSIPIASSSSLSAGSSLIQKTNKYPLSNRNDCENGMGSGGVYHPKRKIMRTNELSSPPLASHHYYHRQLQPQLKHHYYYDQDENDDYDEQLNRRQPLLHGHVPPPVEHYSQIAVSAGYEGGSFVSIKAPGSVLMVYGLDPLNANAEKLFNILCLYGNVIKVKFLKTKEGTAMVEMGDSFQADKCVSHLTNIVCSSFGGSGGGGGSRSNCEHFQEFKFQLQISKQNFISDVLSPFRLADNSLSFRDFSNSKNNRFLTLQASNKNRYTSPCKIVHFFNTPPHVTDDELINVFRRYNVPTPIRIHRLTAKSDKSSTGFLEFQSIGDAVAAIVCCNHAAVESSESKFPFIMKLCFSSYKNEIPTSSSSSSSSGGGGGK